MSHQLIVSTKTPAPEGWLARFVSQLRSITLGPYNTKDKTLARIFGGGSRSLAGIPVTEDTAFNYSAFWQGVGLIAGHVASTPLIHYKNLQPSGKTRYQDSRLYRMLRNQFNPHMSAFVAKEVMQAHVLSWGNAYAEIERNRDFQPVALWPLTPDRVEPFYGDDGEVYYRVSNPNGRDVIIPSRDMIHIPGMGFDGLQGWSVVRRARESIGLGMAAEKFGAAFFGNGSTFGGVLTSKEVLDDEDEAALRATIEGFHQGIERAHRFLILTGAGLEYQTLGVPPHDAEFLETRKFQVEEIARWLNLPPHKLKHLERSTNNNIEHQGIEYYTDTLLPWLIRWEQELNRKLISPLEQNQQFIEHLPEALLRGDIESRYNAYAVGRQWGWLSANMILEKENMNPIGPQGDMFLVPSNMAPANKMEALIDSQIEKNQQKPAAPVGGSGGRDLDLDKLAAEIRAEMRELAQQAETHLARAISAETDLESATTDYAELAQKSEEAQEALQAVQRDLADKQALLAVVTEQAKNERLVREAAEAAQALIVDEIRQNKDHVATVMARTLEVETAQQAAEAAAQEAEKRAIEAETALRAAEEEREAANAQATAAADERDRIMGEQKAIRAVLDKRVNDLTSERDAALAALVEAERKAQESESRAAAEASAKAEALEVRKQAEVARLMAVLAAHRGLIIDAMGRMVRRETEKARRHQATPEKLRSWMQAFYVTHQDTCVDAILPAVSTHLAWRGATESAADVAGRYVTEHIAESVRQLRAVLEGTEAEDFAVTLERTLQRWEQDRPNALADRLLREEIEYVRSYR